MDKLLQAGQEQGLIAFDADRKTVTYLIQNKKLRYSDPEEKVRAQAYLSLVLDYGYPPAQIDIEHTVPHRVPSLYADIVVFKDAAQKEP